jgi:hypothetical protein
VAHTTNDTEIIKTSQETFQQFVQDRLREAVRTALISILEEEVTAFIGAAPYERGEERRDHRNGHYTRNLETTVGQIPDLPVPRTRGGYQPQLFERYHRRREELDGAIGEMFVLPRSRPQCPPVPDLASARRPSRAAPCDTSSRGCAAVSVVLACVPPFHRSNVAAYFHLVAFAPVLLHTGHCVLLQRWFFILTYRHTIYFLLVVYPIEQSKVEHSRHESITIRPATTMIDRRPEWRGADRFLRPTSQAQFLQGAILSVWSATPSTPLVTQPIR